MSQIVTHPNVYEARIQCIRHALSVTATIPVAVSVWNADQNDSKKANMRRVCCSVCCSVCCIGTTLRKPTCVECVAVCVAVCVASERL